MRCVYFLTATYLYNGLPSFNAKCLAINQKVNEECDLDVGINDIFKADNPILSIVSSETYFKGGKCYSKNI